MVDGSTSVACTRSILSLDRLIATYNNNHGSCSAVVKVVMCSRGGGSASEVETHKNIYISSSQHIFR